MSKTRAPVSIIVFITSRNAVMSAPRATCENDAELPRPTTGTFSPDDGMARSISFALTASARRNEGSSVQAAAPAVSGDAERLDPPPPPGHTLRPDAPDARWPGGAKMDSLKGKTIRIRFNLKDCRFYTFEARASK